MTLPPPGTLDPAEMEKRYRAYQQENHGTEIVDVFFAIDDQHPEHGVKLYQVQKRHRLAIKPEIIAMPMQDLEPIFMHYLYVKYGGEAKMQARAQADAQAADQPHIYADTGDGKSGLLPFPPRGPKPPES